MKNTTVLLILFVLLVSVIGYASADNEMVTICHKPGTDDEKTLSVASPALNAHLSHGDYPGECGLPSSPYIIGQKWEDLNADGNFDSGEPGIGGWIIYIDYDNDNLLDDGEPSGLTATDGRYAIVDITPGTWTVREVPQEDWNCSYPNLGIESAPVVSSQCFYTLTFNANGGLLDKDFANWKHAVKRGYNWYDEDLNGHWDIIFEPPIPGWTIELWDITTGVPLPLAAATTDGNGCYEFDLLDPGRSYAVCEVLSFSFTQTFPNASTQFPAGEQLYDCTSLGEFYGPYGYQFTALSGDTYLGNNFGNIEP